MPVLDGVAIDLARQAGRALDLALATVTGLATREPADPLGVAGVTVATLRGASASRDAHTGAALEIAIAIAVPAARVSDATVTTGTTGQNGDDNHGENAEPHRARLW